MKNGGPGRCSELCKCKLACCEEQNTEVDEGGAEPTPEEEFCPDDSDTDDEEEDSPMVERLGVHQDDRDPGLEHDDNSPAVASSIMDMSFGVCGLLEDDEREYEEQLVSEGWEGTLQQVDCRDQVVSAPSFEMSVWCTCQSIFRNETHRIAQRPGHSLLCTCLEHS